MNHRNLILRRFILVCLAALCLAMMHGFWFDSQIKMEDALFLAKNSINELKEHFKLQSKHLHYRIHHPQIQNLQNDDPQFQSIQNDDPQTQSIQDLYIEDIDYPLNNMINSIFPIDAKIELNTSSEYYEMLARYASFSPILNFPLQSQYRVFPNNACESANASEMHLYDDKILVVLRGGCTFVKKVKNLVELNPKAIIIANDEPSNGLITMYSSTYNEDRSLTIPVLFTTLSTYKLLKDKEKYNTVIRLSTISLGNWLNVLLSMMLSPPLLILSIYVTIQVIKHLRKIGRNKRSQKIVKGLPVYIYNRNHLINYTKFYGYLNLTGQTETLTNNMSTSSLDSLKPSPSSSNASMNDFKINGIDVSKIAPQYNILLMNKDFYPSFKCLICLDSFEPLKSRVLVLDCKHFFHETCLSNWLINFKRSCPLCNKAVFECVSPSLFAGQSSTYGSTDEESDIGMEQNDTSSVETYEEQFPLLAGPSAVTLEPETDSTQAVSASSASSASSAPYSQESASSYVTTNTHFTGTNSSISVESSERRLSNATSLRTISSHESNVSSDSTIHLSRVED